MINLEVFFDYACPYCLAGHENLMRMIARYPIEVEWRPCEAHPRPGRYGPHSDLCARGMYFALERAADLWEYHARMYRAALTDRADIEDPRVVAERADGLVDTGALYAALAGGAYLDRLLENNRLAWEVYRFPAVPSYRMNGRLLESVENIGVSEERLAAFLLGPVDTHG